MNFFNSKNNHTEQQNGSAQPYVNGLSGDAEGSRKQATRSASAFEAVSLALYHDLFAAGEQRAVESGAFKIVPEDEASLIEHARASAQDAKRDLFDPAADLADRLRADEFEKLLADRKEMEIIEKHSVAALYAAEEELADKQVGQPPTSPPKALQIAAMAVIALSVAVTLHDQVFQFSDDVTAWGCSFLAGLLTGWFVSALLLYNSGTEHSAAMVRRFGLIAGVAIGLGLFALRIAQTHTSSSIVFAAGMTLLELGAVIGLDSVAQRYRDALREFRTGALVLSKAEATRDAVQKKLMDCQQKLHHLEAGIQEHISYVNERRLRHKHVAELEALAIQGARDGYAAGVAKNLGMTRTGKGKKGGAK